MTATATRTRRTTGALTRSIGRQPLAELLVQQIMDLIRRGSLRPGDKLPSERELAQKLDVSRPSVRESLRALSILGVVNIRHGGGVHVSSLEASELLNPLDFFISIDPANMVSLFDARVHFEPMIARIAATRLTEADLAALRSVLAEQAAEPDDAELFHVTDIELHRIITEACGNAFLIRIAKTMQVLGERGRQLLQSVPGFREGSIRDHRLILAALEARDAARAAMAMERHFARVRDILVERMGTGR